LLKFKGSTEADLVDKDEWVAIGVDDLDLGHSQHSQLCRSENSSFSDFNSAANWVPDTLKRNCEICNAKFSKFFKKKHHCRQCGGIVCGPCSNSKDYVSGY